MATSKTYDKALPFTRINSPSENRFPKLDGDGHKRGTRREADFRGFHSSPIDAFVARVMVTVPSWVPTRGTSEKDVEHEIQGVLARSFQTWTDTPPFQWHRWYDWNFHILPEAPYRWLRGRGNDGGEEGSQDSAGGLTGPHENVVAGDAMECEWDTGAFAAASDPRPGPMFDADWAWPMTNQRVWLVGRSIYDGGHESAGRPPLCRSELHPCKAVASARWEAFHFQENNGGKAGGSVYTPAIQFLFFTTRFGGYFDYPDLQPANGKPYEFIVDLPEAPAAATAHMAIGGTPDTAVNTVVLRANQLLKDFDRARFRNARGASTAAAVDPVIELLPEDPAQPRKRQVKLTIPLAALTGDTYGVLVSLGWRDANGEQAARVKKCTVKMLNVFKGAISHDRLTEEWRFKAGVNGRWFQWLFTGVFNNSDHAMVKDQKGRSTELIIYLHEDDALQFSAHGAELNPVDDVYGPTDGDRTVSLSNDDVNFEVPPGDPQLPRGSGRATVAWGPQVDVRPIAPDPPPAGTAAPPRTAASAGSGLPGTAATPGAPASYPVQRAVARRLVHLMWSTFGDQNSPLGLVDAIASSPDREKPHNPLLVRTVAGRGERKLSLTGYHTWERGRSAELVERPHRTDADATNKDNIDYRIDFSVTVQDQ